MTGPGGSKSGKIRKIQSNDKNLEIITFNVKPWVILVKGNEANFR